mmetsp:Transcript_13636/g.9623  ORF Transcript_13636/g.9623 Transcript_13636/m.9623 type:complete len:82 (+) Transcript_13636:212-457(+)
MLSEPSFNSLEYIKQRERTCEVAFEKLDVDRFSMVPAATLKLFSQCQHNGFVIDLGHELTQLTPIQNGHVMYKPTKLTENG